jgi:hypothetical protein
VLDLEDGVTKVIDGRHYRQTANGRWREVNKTYGDFFQKTSKRPEGVVRGMWNTLKRQSKIRQEKALLEMNRILARNVTRLAEAVDEETKQMVIREDNKIRSQERKLRKEIESNKVKKRELDDFIAEERRAYVDEDSDSNPNGPNSSDEDEPPAAPPDSGGASGSGMQAYIAAKDSKMPWEETESRDDTFGQETILPPGDSSGFACGSLSHKSVEPTGGNLETCVSGILATADTSRTTRAGKAN